MPGITGLFILSREKVLIFGASGFVGRHLFSRLGTGRAAATYHSAPFPEGVKFDVLSMALSDLALDLDEFSHAVILVGNTSPDWCARNQDLSNALNVTAIKRLIDQLSGAGISPLFTSTEVVFDGAKGEYVETDLVSPMLLYGRQKVAIEEYLSQKAEDHIIVRMAHVYDSDPAGGGLLADWFRKVSAGGARVRCAGDYISSVVHVDDAAEAIIRLINEKKRGLYHVGGPEPLSRVEVFEVLCDEMRQAGPVNVEMIPCNINDFPTEEGRPLNISLVSGKLEQEVGMSFRALQSACRDIVSRAVHGHRARESA
jgi:dTDP-4-dehydrorhamnose reductase